MSNNQIYSLAIIGLGNIGSRHLESILKCDFKINIYIYDTNQSLLKKNFNKIELYSSNINIIAIKNLKEIPAFLDFCIVATPSTSRLSTILEIKSSIRFLLLEKILTSSRKELEIFSKQDKNYESVFVNMPYYYQDIFQIMKKEINKPKEIIFRGNDFGIACNLVHFLHISEKFLEKKITNFSQSSKKIKWIASKRLGFYDLLGEIKLTLPSGEIIKFLDEEINKPGLIITLKDKNDCIEYEWETGEIIKNGSLLETKTIPYQSTRTLRIIYDLIEGKEPKVSTLKNAIRIHHFLVDILSPSWNDFVKSQENNDLSLAKSGRMLIT